jgi:hypothetical protein
VPYWCCAKLLGVSPSSPVAIDELLRAYPALLDCPTGTRSLTVLNLAVDIEAA